MNINKNSAVRVIFFGTPEFVVPVLQVLQQNYDVVGVVTAPDKAVGRKQILTSTPVKTWATEHQIPVFTPSNLNQINSELITLNSELFVVAAYGKIIPQNILDIPKYGALNIHPSCLPKYRGPSPIQATILEGTETSCITIMQMDEKMDHGPIITTKQIELSYQDIFETLSKKMFLEGSKLLIDIIPDYLSGKIQLRPQDDTKATLTKIITKEDGYFDINNPPSNKILDRMIRAYYPWPTAWTRWSNKIVKFLPRGLIQMEGKKPTKLEDFLRGYPNFPIKSFYFNQTGESGPNL